MILREAFEKDQSKLKTEENWAKHIIVLPERDAQVAYGELAQFESYTFFD